MECDSQQDSQPEASSHSQKWCKTATAKWHICFSVPASKLGKNRVIQASMLTASTPGVNLAMWLYKPLNCCCLAAPRFGGAESPHSHYFKPGHSSESNVKASSVDWMLSGLKTTQDSFRFHHFRHGCLPSAASRIQVRSFLWHIGNFLLASESSKGPLSPNLKPCKYVRI